MERLAYTRRAREGLPPLGFSIRKSIVACVADGVYDRVTVSDFIVEPLEDVIENIDVREGALLSHSVGGSLQGSRWTMLLLIYCERERQNQPAVANTYDNVICVGVSRMSRSQEGEGRARLKKEVSPGNCGVHGCGPKRESEGRTL